MCACVCVCVGARVCACVCVCEKGTEKGDEFVTQPRLQTQDFRQ